MVHRGAPVLDVYPLLPRSMSSNGHPATPQAYPRVLVFTSVDRKGFVACGGDAPIDRALPSTDPNYRQKTFPIYVDSDIAVRDSNPHVLPALIFEENKFVFTKGAQGSGQP